MKANEFDKKFDDDDSDIVDDLDLSTLKRPNQMQKKWMSIFLRGWLIRLIKRRTGSALPVSPLLKSG